MSGTLLRAAMGAALRARLGADKNGPQTASGNPRTLPVFPAGSKPDKG